MTPEQRSKFNKIGRQGVLETLRLEGMPRVTIDAALEWLAEDDGVIRRAAACANRAAWIAATAAMIAAIAAIAEWFK